jgi:hypothetical protein
MILNEWENLPATQKRTIIAKAFPEPLGKAQHFFKPWLLDNPWVLDLFVKEIIAARDSGKQHYSAQRIYEYLAHKGQTRGRHLRFIEHNKAAHTLAAIVTSIFSFELAGFFDEQGVVA